MPKGRCVVIFFHKSRNKLPRAGNEEERIVQLLTLHGVEAVIDVGANEGQYARRLRSAGYRDAIVSVEPGAAAHAALSGAADGDPNWSVARRMAVGEKAGLAQLHVSTRSDMSSLKEMSAVTREAFPKAAPAGEETVTVERLDAVFDELVGSDVERVFLKIDTQGSEVEVLRGAEGVLPRIVGMQLEMSLVPLYDGEPPYLALLTELDRLGFDPHLFLKGFFSRRLRRQLQFDGVFFRT
ncbi:MAG: FkbM family methyltransferase [Alphaproteobacteria bacterium]|nr:FkbM family methyltransferase [Alphaproteobacteria bacterium]